MKSLEHKRTFLLIVGGIAILIIAFLSANLDTLDLKPAAPFRPAIKEDGVALVPVEAPPEVLFWYLTILVAGVMILAMIILMIFSAPKQRRRILLFLLLTVFLLVVVALLISSDSEPVEVVATPVPLPEPTEEMPEDIPVQELDTPPSEFVAPPISPWISFGVTFGVLAVLALLAWFFLGRRSGEEFSLDDLAGIARETIEDLQAGKDYGDAVIECYARMAQAVQEKRGLKLRAHMTPAEFAASLERARLPGEAVRRLTALFERVRYGGRKSTQQDIDEAVASLTTIVDGCKEAL